MMGKRYRWVGYGLLTVANISVLLLIYFALVRSPELETSPLPQQTISPPMLLTIGPTPTPIPLINIVIALQNLPRGYRFPTRIEELENIVWLFPWPESAVPFNALREDQGGLEFVMGKIARTDIFREQPILSNMLVDNMVELANIGSDVAALVPPDRVAKTIRLTRETLPVGLAVSDRVNIFYTVFGGDPARPMSITGLLVQDALVLVIGELPPGGRFLGVYPTPTFVPFTGNGRGPTVTLTPAVEGSDIIPVVLTVSNQDAAELIWAEENQLPLSLVIRSPIDVSRIVITPVRQDTIPPSS